MCEISRSEFNDAFPYIAEDIRKADFIGPFVMPVAGEVEIGWSQTVPALSQPTDEESTFTLSEAECGMSAAFSMASLRRPICMSTPLPPSRTPESGGRNTLFFIPAFDTEFTGLTLNDNSEPSLFDTGGVRYQKLRLSVQSYMPSQIGISAFIKVGDLNTYDVRSYNFYLYPVPFGPIDVRFLCQASSFEFLCQHKFDFNKFIYDGVPYLNEHQEQVLQAHLQSVSWHNSNPRNTDAAALQECCSVVAKWAVTAVEGDRMEVPGPEAVSEYIALTELRLCFPKTWASVTDGKIIVERVSTDRRKELEAAIEEKTQESNVLTSMLGFTRIFRLMVELKKPLVGHNCFTDLLILYEKFHKPLPKSFAKFKKDITTLFPHMYDTKHIVNSLRMVYERLDKSGLVSQTGLANLFNALETEKGRFFTLCQPGWRHAAGFDRYRDKHSPHEAGYDAFMCGAVFLRLAHITCLRGVVMEYLRAQEFTEHLAAVTRYQNCINIIRASTDYVKLDGQDPPSRRPQYLYVRSRKWNAPLNSAMVAQLFLQYATVDIQMTDRTQALVAIGNHYGAREILKKFRNHERIHVVQYNILKHSPIVRNFLWAGVAVSTGLCLWALWDGMKK